MPNQISRRNTLKAVSLALISPPAAAGTTAHASPSDKDRSAHVVYKTQTVETAEVFYREAGPADAPGHSTPAWLSHR